MPAISYSLYLNDEAASREQLQRLETITVEQEIDNTWEARVEVPICINDQGRWRAEDERFLRDIERVRIEVHVGNSTPVALIDGPVVGYDRRMSAAPGESMVILEIRDDSVYIDLVQQVDRYEDRTDCQIAQQIYTAADHIDPSEHIAETGRGSGPLTREVMQRETPMEFLRRLAQPYHMHAYVLPGTQPGHSVGFFQPFPDPEDRGAEWLPELVLFGAGRNIRSFQVQRNGVGPASAQTSTVTINDRSVVTGTASFRDRRLLGRQAAPGAGLPAPRRLLQPGSGTEDPSREAEAAADELSFSYEASGSMLEGCYSGVLMPYRLVTARVGDSSLSGAYVVKKVTHTLSRSNYTQEFVLLRDGETELDVSPQDLLRSSIL